MTLLTRPAPILDRAEIRRCEFNTGASVLSTRLTTSSEDCYHLSQLLPDANEKDVQLTQEALEQIFSAYAQRRQPRTAALVKGARAQGDKRVLSGSADDILKRNALLTVGWEDKDALVAKYDNLCQQPF